MDSITFNTLIFKKPLVLVEFYADWCEPCKILDDILEEVKVNTREVLFIQKIDVDVSEGLSQFYQVMSVPVLILFKNGEPVWRMNGFMMAPELIKTLREFIGN